MRVLSAPQRVETLWGGGWGRHNNGARGCAAGELGLGPGGGFRAGRGLPAGGGGWYWGAEPRELSQADPVRWSRPGEAPPPHSAVQPPHLGCP